jgi:competence protein ComEC
MTERILWATVGGFLSGVLVRSLVVLSLPAALFCVLVGSVALLYLLVDREKRNALLVVGIACIACGAGIARMDSATLVGDPALDARIGSKVVLEGRVAAEPDLREAATRISVQTDSLVEGGAAIPAVAGVLVLAPPHAAVSYGDRVRVSGILRLPEAFDAGAGRRFDYPNYLAKDGILYQLGFAQVENLGENSGNPVKAAAIWTKRQYLRGLGSTLPEPEAGLAGGITVGDKRSIGEELSDVFIRVSLIHMVVLSGYNITVVINAAARALAWAPRAFQFGGSGVVVVFFILMSGGAPTAVRAGAMALLAMYARVSGRMFVALRALAVVATAMVLWNPFTLAFDPSFQLSALATLGLILFTPHLASRMSWIPERLGLREIVATTIGTQLAVLPLLLYQNGNLSIVSIPANLFALIPVPAAMAASFVAAVGGMLAGPLAAPLAFPAYVLLAYIIKVAELFSMVPFASVTVPAFSAWWMVVAYAGLFTGLAVLEKRKSRN